MDKIIYMHVDPLEVDGAGDLKFLPVKMTIACQREGNTLKIAAAYCSPGDQFSKAHGRSLAARKLNMPLEVYKERMQYYRKGVGTKPLGYHLTSEVSSMNDENWYSLAHEFMHFTKPSLLRVYSEYKGLHLERLETTENAKHGAPVQG